MAPSMAATASDMSATNTLEKSYRDMDKNIKPSYYDTHKIQNGTRTGRPLSLKLGSSPIQGADSSLVTIEGQNKMRNNAYPSAGSYKDLACRLFFFGGGGLGTT